MNDLCQIQLQLFGLPRLAGLRTLEDGRSVMSLARPIAPSFDSQSVDVLLIGRIGGNFLKNQTADRHLLSVGHSVFPASVEEQSTMEPVTCASTNLGHLIQGAVA